MFTKDKLPTWILIGLVGFLLFLQMTSSPVVVKDNTEILKKIDSYQSDIKEIDKKISSHDKNLETIGKQMKQTETRIYKIQNNLSNEKHQLEKATDDDNVRYFLQYVAWYRESSRNGQGHSSDSIK